MKAKRLITLFLMLTTLSTFSLSVLAVVPVNNSEMSMVDCAVQMADNDDCGDNTMHDMSDCQNECRTVNCTFVLLFVAQSSIIVFNASQQNYPIITSAAPYYFPESLYRPPLI